MEIGRRQSKRGAEAAAPPPAAVREVRDEVVAMIPTLRAYARSLTRNAVDADDLVQETLVKALRNIERFQPGTNLRAWLFTIMRNAFFNSFNKRKREDTGRADCVSAIPVVQPQHDRHMIGRQLARIIDNLPEPYRDTFVLVVVLGEDYETAATLAGCAVGTVKSRLNRARALLMEQLDEDTLAQLARQR